MIFKENVNQELEEMKLAYFNCSDMQKNYGSVVALRNGSISVGKGEVRAILGGNGSGKSTLAKIIGGSVKPDSGSIVLDNETLDIRSPSFAKRQGLIITSQELSLLPNLTVEKNLTLTRIPKRGLFTDKKKMREKAKHALRMVGLENIANKLVSELPDNQNYMIEFAKALLQEPKVLVIDEITSALYRDEVERVSEIIKEISSQGTAVLFISHRMSEIFSICSSVTVMRNGSVVDTHQLDMVTEDMLIEEMVGSKEHKSDLKEESLEMESSEVMLSVKNMEIHEFNSEINLEVKKGEFIGIAGLQGQGQSIFLKRLFGLKGKIEIVIDRQPVKIHSPRDAVKAGMGFLTGDRTKDGAFIGRSLLENLNVVNSDVLRNKKLNHAELLQDYNVKFSSVDQPIESLSGGNQQKVVIARWTGTKPKVLLADDPTKGIDVRARMDVHDIFKNLVLHGSTVIMVSSDDEELVAISRMIKNTKVLVMYNGQIAKTLTGNEISVSKIIAASIPKRGEVSGLLKATV